MPTYQQLHKNFIDKVKLLFGKLIYHPFHKQIKFNETLASLLKMQKCWILPTNFIIAYDINVKVTSQSCRRFNRKMLVFPTPTGWSLKP